MRLAPSASTSFCSSRGPCQLPGGIVSSVLPGLPLSSWAWTTPDRRPAAGRRGLGRAAWLLVHHQGARGGRSGARADASPVSSVERSLLFLGSLAIAYSPRPLDRDRHVFRHRRRRPANRSASSCLTCRSPRSPRAHRARWPSGAVVYLVRRWPSSVPHLPWGWCLRWQIPNSPIPNPNGIAPRPPQGAFWICGFGNLDFAARPEGRAPPPPR